VSIFVEIRATDPSMVDSQQDLVRLWRWGGSVGVANVVGTMVDEGVHDLW